MEYTKYRWFITSTGKTVIGGKSSKQNESLLMELKNKKANHIVLHTTQPGSPFSIILADSKKVTKSDLEQAAIFTACFSQAWKQGKKKTSVDIFHLSKMFKIKTMKTGTWGVKEKIKSISVSLNLVITKQNDKLRAVPEKSAKSKLLKIAPGKTDKKKMLTKLQVLLPNSFSQEELLSALPAGGLRILK
jgi:hypothetical protein